MVTAFLPVLTLQDFAWSFMSHAPVRNGRARQSRGCCTHQAATSRNMVVVENPKSTNAPEINARSLRIVA